MCGKFSLLANLCVQDVISKVDEVYTITPDRTIERAVGHDRSENQLPPVIE
jgi:hypothetical protein